MKKKCIICGNGKLEQKYPKVEDYEYGTYCSVDYLQCDQCGLLIQDPLPSEKNIPSFYPLDYRNLLQVEKRGLYSTLKTYQMNSLARDVEHIINNKKANILEIGCGGGLLLLSLQNRGFTKLWGTDLSSASDIYLSQHGITFKKANIEKTFPFDTQFDLIILNHVIEHLLHPQLVLAQCVKHLSKVGKIIVVTPNSKSLVMEVFNRYCDGINAPRHFFLFSPQSMNILKKTLGFRELTYYPVLDPMQWAISLQNRLQTTQHFRTKLRRGLAWYTIFLGILCIPISFITVFNKKSASMMCVLE